MVPYITLSTGAQMPLLGLGMQHLAGDEVGTAVKCALDLGYRLFDTASSYKNEEELGTALKEAGIPRSEVFLTTKIWNNAQRIGNIESAFNRSLERLQVDYVDLYLIQWPVPGCYLETWQALEAIYSSGRARAIGVSNFNELELADLIDHSRIMPAVCQFEMHPLNSHARLRGFCQSQDIAVQASAPLAQGLYLERDIFISLAEKYNRSPAQIGLRWNIQHGAAVIPKSARIERLLENSQIFDFELTESEMEAIDAVNEDLRVVEKPDDLP